MPNAPLTFTKMWHLRNHSICGKMSKLGELEEYTYEERNQKYRVLMRYKAVADHSITYYKTLTMTVGFDFMTGELRMPFLKGCDVRINEEGGIDLFEYFTDPFKPTQDEELLFVLEFGLKSPFYGGTSDV